MRKRPLDEKGEKKRPLVEGESPDGVIVFWCKECRANKTYLEREGMECEWLTCSCRCYCACHESPNWNKEDCVCKPCYPCGKRETPKTSPIASCGNRRFCHFDKRCNKRGMCSFYHTPSKEEIEEMEAERKKKRPENPEWD